MPETVRRRRLLGELGLVLLAGCIVAGLYFVHPAIGDVAPSDAPVLAGAGVGDCVGTASKDYPGEEHAHFRPVPCWYRSAAFRVAGIGAPEPGVEPAEFCRAQPGWSAGRAVRTAEPRVFCLAQA